MILKIDSYSKFCARQWQIPGVAMVSAETPSERACICLIIGSLKS